MTPILTRKKAAVVCLETTYGVAPPIEQGVLMLVTELTPTPYQGNTVERTRMRSELGGFAQINTGPNTQLQLTVPWSGSGTAPVIGTSATAPALGLLLRACQMHLCNVVFIGSSPVIRSVGRRMTFILILGQGRQFSKVKSWLVCLTPLFGIRRETAVKWDGSGGRERFSRPHRS